MWLKYFSFTSKIKLLSSFIIRISLNHFIIIWKMEIPTKMARIISATCMKASFVMLPVVKSVPLSIIYMNKNFGIRLSVSIITIIRSRTMNGVLYFDKKLQYSFSPFL